jgi:hypothetical protein
MGHVYLIGEVGNDGKYKIGSTRAKNVDTRLKQLQTGNPSQLYIKESFETDHPFKLEKMLHNRFKSSNLIGEWFELSEADTGRFKGICEECSRVIDSLKENPFYFKVEIPLDKWFLDRYTQEELQQQIEEITRNVDGRILGEISHPSEYERKKQ